MIKSDGNGNTIVNLKPAWVGVCLTMIIILISIGGFVFGYGVKSEKISTLEKSVVDLQTSDSNMKEMLVEVRNDVKWIKQELQRK